MSFYKKKTWIRKREKILKRDEYLCRECKRYGKTTQATTVHHIIPLAWCLIYKILFALASINLPLSLLKNVDLNYLKKECL